MGKLFGTYGIRGVANIHPMTTEMAMQVGRGTAFIFKNQKKRHRIVIGKDTRLSGYMIENALVAGICSMGVDVLLVGPLPTPGIAYITTSMRADAGIVISASHNPFQDNGIKIFSGNGFKLPDQLENKIEELIFTDHLDCGSVASPFRETESMKDGSDAVADWPLLNALVNTAAGASWVSIHNGGGVGIGYSLHAGQVTVADGSDMMASRIERVLTTDPGMGVIRHVDAGYDEAKEFAAKTNVRIPMAQS